VNGPNSGYVFEAAGAAHSDDDLDKDYAGLIFAYNNSTVRLWAPSQTLSPPPAQQYSKGFLIGVGDGLAGELYSQFSHTGNVRVRAWREECPHAFDSGWFAMESQAGQESYREVIHNLGAHPIVRILTQDPTTGFIYEGVSIAQTDDDVSSKQYGGLAFATGPERVRLWAPDMLNAYAEGRIINVFDGWGGEVNAIRLQSALVRVIAYGRSCQSMSFLSLSFFLRFFF